MNTLPVLNAHHLPVLSPRCCCCSSSSILSSSRIKFIESGLYPLKTLPSRTRVIRCSLPKNSPDDSASYGGGGSGGSRGGGGSTDASQNQSNFCIIEGPDTVQDFVQMQMQEIQDNIKSRRNKIFLLMEEVRRLRVQQRIKGVKVGEEVETMTADEMPDIQSTIPFIPNLTPKTLKKLYLTCFSMISGIVVFGGLLAPVLELKLGIGGTSYEDFIRSLHLPLQLSQVDPIVASFSGGAVGVISCLMLIEANNVQKQEKKRCKYCYGTGYLSCARCSASGVCLKANPISVSSDSVQPLQAPKTERCSNCSGAGKVMCPTCLCTGLIMASEHDPRIDPFEL